MCLKCDFTGMTGQTVTGEVEAEEEEGGEEEAVVTEIETGIGGGQGNEWEI